MAERTKLEISVAGFVFDTEGEHVLLRRIGEKSYAAIGGAVDVGDVSPLEALRRHFSRQTGMVAPEDWKNFAVIYTPDKSKATYYFVIFDPFFTFFSKKECEGVAVPLGYLAAKAQTGLEWLVHTALVSKDHFYGLSIVNVTADEDGLLPLGACIINLTETIPDGTALQADCLP